MDDRCSNARNSVRSGRSIPPATRQSPRFDRLPPEHALGRYLTEINELIESSGCRELSFDLAGVTAIPSGFLGVLASVLKKGVAVCVQHPSPEVREVLALTNFDRLIKVI